MNNKKLKVSELIKNSCCGTLLDVPKNQLVLMAKKLESDNERLKAEIKRLESEKRTAFVIFISLFFSLLILINIFLAVQ